MDRQTQHELDRLLDGFTDALERVRSAGRDDEQMEAWKKVQMLGWELNALLPVATQQPRARS